MSRRRFDRVTDYRRIRRPKVAGLRVLVVCEGSKTEPIYIRGLKRYARGLKVNLEEFGPECGSDPQSVVEYMSERLQEDGGFDLAFALVDVDEHDKARSAKARQIVQELNAKYVNRVFLLTSDPCIEFWFILHFEYTRAPFAAVGNKSAGDAAVSKLKTHLPNYGKADGRAICEIFPSTPAALDNAKAAAADALATSEPNPSTNMDDFFVKISELAGVPWDFTGLR